MTLKGKSLFSRGWVTSLEAALPNSIRIHGSHGMIDGLSNRVQVVFVVTFRGHLVEWISRVGMIEAELVLHLKAT